MPRRMLTDEHWPKLHAIMLQENIYDKLFLRETVEGILYRLLVQDVPSAFGKWNTLPTTCRLSSIYQALKNMSAKPVIPRWKNSKTGNASLDWYFYRYRHLVENAFARFRQFRAMIAYAKRQQNLAKIL